MKRKWDIFWKKKSKTNNRGVTLVEALVATVVLALAVVPLMNSLVSSARINAKARIQQDRTTLCQTIMEQVKAQSLHGMHNDIMELKYNDAVTSLDFAGTTIKKEDNSLVGSAPTVYDGIFYKTPEYPLGGGEKSYQKIIKNYHLTYDNVEGYYVAVDGAIDESSPNRDAAGESSTSVGFYNYSKYSLSQYVQYKVTVSLYKTASDRTNSTNPVATFSGSARDFVKISYSDPNTTT